MKIENKYYVIVGCVIAVVAAFFAGAYVQQDGSMGSMVAPMMATRESMMESSMGGGMAGEVYALKSMPSPMPPYGTPTAGQTAAEVDQKIIKNGTLELSVDNVGASAANITAIASENGGFIQQTDIQERADGTHYGFVIVRIPAKSFESAMMRMKAEAKLVTRESVNGQDVTEQYTDLQAQLRNAQAQERTYLAVLDKAKTVQDILNVQQYLGQIRSQIESLQGRIQYLKNLTEYSTITVTLMEEPSVRAPTKEFRPGTIVDQAVQSLIELGQSLIAAAIWIGIVGGGTLIPLAILIWLLWLIFRRRKSR